MPSKGRDTDPRRAKALLQTAPREGGNPQVKRLDTAWQGAARAAGEAGKQAWGGSGGAPGQRVPGLPCPGAHRGSREENSLRGRGRAGGQRVGSDDCPAWARVVGGGGGGRSQGRFEGEEAERAPSCSGALRTAVPTAAPRRLGTQVPERGGSTARKGCSGKGGYLV